eukprot:6188157-Pleurochrysis_carterae.AAC.3
MPNDLETYIHRIGCAPRPYGHIIPSCEPHAALVLRFRGHMRFETTVCCRRVAWAVLGQSAPGRTARGTASGDAITFFNPLMDKPLARALEAQVFVRSHSAQRMRSECCVHQAWLAPTCIVLCKPEPSNWGMQTRSLLCATQSLAGKLEKVLLQHNQEVPPELAEVRGGHRRPLAACCPASCPSLRFTCAASAIVTAHHRLSLCSAARHAA